MDLGKKTTHKDQCKPWDPIGIANEYTLINTIFL